jgi:hypothetical protein
MTQGFSVNIKCFWKLLIILSVLYVHTKKNDTGTKNKIVNSCYENKIIF